MRLSMREQQVLEGWARGQTLQQIANDCGIAHGTAQVYAKRLRAKAQPHRRRTAIVAQAYREGLIR